jgi:hypothetical protein
LGGGHVKGSYFWARMFIFAKHVNTKYECNSAIQVLLKGTCRYANKHAYCVHEKVGPLLDSVLRLVMQSASPYSILISFPWNFCVSHFPSLSHMSSTSLTSSLTTSSMPMHVHSLGFTYFPHWLQPLQTVVRVFKTTVKLPCHLL